tara:strand:- start:4161 stop:5207 length:1047 start_codon:yes stop_codon:yes gene_type:complete
MIKIKILELDKHRNETTFRPFIFAQNELKDIGIEFTDSDDYDYVWVGQASIIDKNKPLKESVESGLEFLSKITGDYMIFDGQDATSLIGTIDVFRESNAKLFLKNSYLKDFDLYKKGWANGRMYWGEGDYSVPDIDELKPKMKLSGCNWLHTLQPRWMDFTSDKKYDVSCMFGYPSLKKNYEHKLCQTDYYDKHRKELLKTLMCESCEGDKYKIAGLVNGERVSQEEYYKKMFNSKIVMAPLGYGEMAPRDIESAMFGSVLVKPDMSYIDSKPFIYEDDETYIAVNYDWSNLEEKIDYVLSNYKEVRQKLVWNMRNRYREEYDYSKIALHLYDVFKNLDSVSLEEINE